MFIKKLFSHKSPKAPANNTPVLTSAIATAISNTIGRQGIPIMAGSAQRAFKLSIDPNASARDFVEVIKGDEALSARVLKVANSVFFDRGHKAETIENCVNVLGINELRNLLSATTLSDIFPCHNPARTQFWLNDIATALTAQYICNLIAHPKKDAVFLGGLLHDIGKLLLLQRVEHTYMDVMEKAISNEKDFCGAEEEVFVFNHTEVGQLIAERWNFTPELTEIIRKHHDVPDLSAKIKPSDIPMANIIWIADTISHALGLGHPTNFGRFRNRACEKLDDIFVFLGLDVNNKKEILQDIKNTFEIEKDLYLHPVNELDI